MSNNPCMQVVQKQVQSHSIMCTQVNLKMKCIYKLKDGPKVDYMPNRKVKRHLQSNQMRASPTIQ